MGSCGWYGIGTQSWSDTGISWLDMPSTISGTSTFRQNTLTQLLNDDLPMFDDCIEVDHAEKETEIKDSEKYTKLVTSYSRTVHMARLKTSVSGKAERELNEKLIVAPGLVDQKVYM